MVRGIEVNELAWLKFLRNVSLICNGIGLVIALAFILGPRVLIAISKFLDAYHPTVSLEKILITKARIILGFTLLVITALMLALVIKIKVYCWIKRFISVKQR